MNWVNSKRLSLVQRAEDRCEDSCGMGAKTKRICVQTLFSVLVLILAIPLLAACDRKDVVLWSPDGKRMAVIASDGLVLGDETGKIAAPLKINLEIFRWMPDSKHALVVERDLVTSWKDACSLLTLSRQREVSRYAERSWRLGRMAETFDEQLPGQACLYLIQTYGKTAARAKFKDKYTDFVVASCVRTLDLSETGKLSTGRPLWRAFRTVEDLRVSPTGKLAAISMDTHPGNQICVLALKGGTPRQIVKSHAGLPDWSPNGTSLLFFALPHEYKNTSKEKEASSPLWVGTLDCVKIADTDGNLLPKLPKPSHLVDTLYANDSCVRCLPDGTVLFNSTLRTFPSTTEDNYKNCLFRLSPDYKHVETVAGSDQITPGYQSSFEPNSDGSLIAFSGDQGGILVLETSSGKKTELEKEGKEDLKFLPQWRIKDEICYPARNSIKSPGGHDVDVALQSLEDPSHHLVLSKEWSPVSFEFLNDPKKEKQKSEVRAPIGKHVHHVSRVHGQHSFQQRKLNR